MSSVGDRNDPARGEVGDLDLLRPTLYGRRKSLYPMVVWGAMGLSIVAHWAVFEFGPTLTAEIGTISAPPLISVELPPEVDMPPPPERIARPAVPVVSTRLDLSTDITISTTTFEDYVPPPVAPPSVAEAVIGNDPMATPAFTPFTRAPALLNDEEVARAIRSNYPTVLRDAEIGGEVLLWFFIDEEGAVLQARVAESSGYESMDQAAVTVAPVFRFRPAYNRDLPAKVWVQLPIIFTVRSP